MSSIVNRYAGAMPKRTSPSDANHIDAAADVQQLVTDKRAAWRASGEKTRRRQRRYEHLLVSHLLRQVRPGATDVDVDTD
jgi:hypothetical protein